MNIYRKSQKGLASSSSRGFTLIELLVVIAIIGILSSVVLAGLSIARVKGKDSAVKSNLSTVRSEMELHYLNNNGSYGSSLVADTGNCDTGNINIPFQGGNIGAAITSAETNGNGSATCAIGQNGATWAVSVPLLGDEDNSWCVASIGAGGIGTADGGGSSNDAVCS